MNKNLLPISVFALLFAVAGGTTAFLHPFQSTQTHYNGNNVQANITGNMKTENVNVFAYLNGHKVAETHNVLMTGENAIQQDIGQGAAYQYNTIAVGNGTAPTGSSTTLKSQWGKCGLSPATANYKDTSSRPLQGSWNYSVTYSVSCDNIKVNTTAIEDPSAPSSARYFAGTGLGRTINPYSGDKLTIKWHFEAHNG